MLASPYQSIMSWLQDETTQVEKGGLLIQESRPLRVEPGGLLAPRNIFSLYDNIFEHSLLHNDQRKEVPVFLHITDSLAEE